MEASNNSSSEGESIPQEEENENSCSIITINPLNNKKTIQDLPLETLTKLFGYLTHTGKLISRLVCQEWNNQISSFLSKNSYFEVTSEDSLLVMLNSDVQWTKIILTDKRFILRTKNITTLRVDIRGLRECMEVVVRFPHLTALELNILEDRFKYGNSTKTALQEQKDLELKEQFKEFVMNLRMLSVKFTMKNYETLHGFLKEIDAEDGTLGLCALKIEEEQSNFKGGETEVEDNLSLMSELYRIISKSSPTLVFLNIVFSTETILQILFPELVSKLCDLEELKLESILIQPATSWFNENKEEMLERDFLIHQKFLETQMDENRVVKNVFLPWRQNKLACQEIIQFLSKDVRSVGCVHEEHITDRFFSHCSKLKTMTIVSRALSMFSQPCPSLGKLCVAIVYDVDELSNTDQEDDFYRSLGVAFMNLVELKIGIGNNDVSMPFCNQNLQAVIESLQTLRILHIEDARYITDFGVTGIDEEYSKMLRKTERFHLHLCFPEDKIIGLPLSSLKLLEKLILIGSSISDFGLYYGLRFGAGLKQMAFHSTQQISDWGLHWLGVGNPGLESFDGSCKMGKFSDEGRILIQETPLIMSTKKFKLSSNSPHSRLYTYD